MDILGLLTAELGVKMSQVEAAVKLIDEGNTIPFIARYRKEVTGSLNDEVLRNLDERLKYLRGLEDRKTQILASIEDQGKLTADLKKKIEEAETMVAVEDLYLPFRPKRKTRASMAKERGLEPLADTILLQVTKEPIETLAAQYVSEEKGVADAKAAIDGAKDILTERISEVAKYRAYIRNVTKEEGSIVSAAKDEKTESVYEMYYHHEELVRKCAGHRILALNRGEKEKILTVKIAAPEEKILRYLNKMVITRENPVTTPVLQEAIADSYNRLIAPAIEREVRNLMTEKAEDGAIKIFGKNLEQLLMQPPIAGRVVLGWDPAFRTGCKLAVVDATGKVLDTVVIAFCRQHDDRHLGKLTDRLADLKSIVSRKHDIQKNHVILPFFCPLDRLITVVSTVHLISILFQTEADSLHDQFFIINYQNSCHFSPPRYAVMRRSSPAAFLMSMT